MEKHIDHRLIYPEKRLQELGIKLDEYDVHLLRKLWFSPDRIHEYDAKQKGSYLGLVKFFAAARIGMMKGQNIFVYCPPDAFYRTYMDWRYTMTEAFRPRCLETMTYGSINIGEDGSEVFVCSDDYIQTDGIMSKIRNNIAICYVRDSKQKQDLIGAINGRLTRESQDDSHPIFKNKIITIVIQ